MSSNPIEIPFIDFLSGFRNTLHSAFYVHSDINQLSKNRLLPDSVIKEIMSYNPLSICIPKEYGGRGAPVWESMAIMAEASYESLGLSLALSINYALFIQPVTKYANINIKQPIFSRFLNQKQMGGLMITEPDFGSDALNMQTCYTENTNSFHLTGSKHWAGLTGMANFWLLTARKQIDGRLGRDIDFFICDVDAAGQKVVVEEYFDNLGLYLIPYGLNKIDVEIPVNQRLIPHSSGIKMMLDILHRSRLQFPGMGMGLIKRLLDEAFLHTQSRIVGGKALNGYDQVQQHLAILQSCYTICSALCVVGSEMAALENDLVNVGVQANSIKTVTTDLMQKASQTLLTLVGAKGYKLSHIAGRSIVDSRPFQIFEGSNDILYIQIAEGILKNMSAAKESNFAKYLLTDAFFVLAAKYLGDIINFNLDKTISQRKLFELGKIISRIGAINSLFVVQSRGYNNELVSNACQLVRLEILNLIENYSNSNTTKPVTSYFENSTWHAFINS